MACPDAASPAIVCNTLLDLIALHRAPEAANASIPAGLLPSLERRVFVIDIGHRQIATNGIYSAALARAQGDILLAGYRLDRTAILSQADGVAGVEGVLIRRAIEVLGNALADSWAAACAPLIDEKHRRLSLLRAHMLNVGAAGCDTRIAEVIHDIDTVLARESRRKWG